MNSHRSYSVAGVVKDEVIVTGGYNGSINLSTVEKYNPLNDTWTMLNMLGSPRRYGFIPPPPSNIIILKPEPLSPATQGAV